MQSSYQQSPLAFSACIHPQTSFLRLLINPHYSSRHNVLVRSFPLISSYIQLFKAILPALSTALQSAFSLPDFALPLQRPFAVCLRLRRSTRGQLKRQWVSGERWQLAEKIKVEREITLRLLKVKKRWLQVNETFPSPSAFCEIKLWIYSPAYEAEKWFINY